MLLLSKFLHLLKVYALCELLPLTRLRCLVDEVCSLSLVGDLITSVMITALGMYFLSLFITF